MKAYADILATMAAKLDEGEHDRRISPSIAVITDIETQLEALHQSILLVETYLKRKEAKEKTIIVRL